MYVMTFSSPEINKKDLKLIRIQRNTHSSMKIRLRFNVLWLTKKFNIARLIAEVAGVSERQVFNIVKIYNNSGLKGIMDIEHNKQESKLMGFVDLICHELNEKSPSSIKEAKGIIYQLTGLKRSLTQVRKFLKKLGMKYLKPFLIPMGTKETDLSEKIKKQKAFVKNKLSKEMRDAKNGKSKLLFMDSAHMQIACMLGFIWCFVKKFIPALPVRGRVNVIGATSFYGEDFVYDINQTGVKQEAIIQFLRKIRSRFGKTKVTLVLDNASYHHAYEVQRIAQELNIKLIFLPVASPNLNIIERLWKFIKSKFLKNHVFLNLAELEAALSNGLKTLRKKHKKELRSLLTPKFQYFNDTAQFHAA